MNHPYNILKIKFFPSICSHCGSISVNFTDSTELSKAQKVKCAAHYEPHFLELVYYVNACNVFAKLGMLNHFSLLNRQKTTNDMGLIFVFISKYKDRNVLR